MPPVGKAGPPPEFRGPIPGPSDTTAAAASEVTPLRKTVAAFGLLAAAGVAGQVIGFVALAYIARRTGPALLGAYSVDASIAMYAGVLANFGVTYLAMRDVAHEPAAQRTIFLETTFLVLVCGIVTYFVLCLGVAPALTSQERHLMPIVGAFVLLGNLSPDWFLLSLGRSRPVSAARLVGQLVYGVLVFVVGGTGFVLIQRYAWLNGLGLLITASILFWVALKVRGRALGKSRSLVRRLRTRIGRSLSFGYFLLMLQVYAGVAIPLLALLSGQRAAGIYSVAFRLPGSLIALASVWLTVFFPAGASKVITDVAAYRDDVGRVVSVSIVGCVALAVGAAVAGRDLMPLMFGASFEGAALPFSLLSLAAGLTCIQATTSNVLLAMGAEREYARIVTCVAVGLVAIDGLLIAAAGASGAAGGAVIAEATLVMVTGVAARRLMGGLGLQKGLLVRGLSLVCVMAAVALPLRTTHSAVAEVTGLAGFAVMSGAFLWRTGGMSRDGAPETIDAPSPHTPDVEAEALTSPHD